MHGGTAQIIFCSRTHSQLAQVVGELLRTPFAEEVRAVVLAGRAQLCVNDAVRALGAAPRMNDRCAELKRAGSKRGGSKPKGAKRGAGADGGASAGCPFLRKRRGAVAALKELVLAEPLEVEELAREGRAQGACAYYAARSALPAAHLVLLPYASLLQPEMRCACASFFACFESPLTAVTLAQRDARHPAEWRCAHRGRGAQPA